MPRYTPRLIPTRDGRLRLHTVPQLDLSFNKTTRIHERFRVQFRAEAFNIANTYYMNTAGFSTDLESPNFGTLVPGTIGYGSANFPRQLQFAVKLLW